MKKQEKIILEINNQFVFRKFPKFKEVLKNSGGISITIAKKSQKFKHKFKNGFTISLLLCDENEILHLNNEFRQKNYVTNVLSFEDGDEIDGIIHLGDLAICIPKVKEEAKLQKKTFKTHFIHLFVHGILHLLGFDHEIEQERIEMEEFEDRILEEIAKLDA